MLEQLFTPFNIFFVVIMLIVASLIWRKEPYSAMLPNYFTVAGILGTFIGIAWGLINLDVDNLDTSIPPFLKWLTTAFVTSIAGIFFGLVFRFFNRYHLIHSEAPKAPQIDSLLTELIEQVKDGNSTIVDALSGTDPEALLSQFKLLRTDINDNNKAITEIVQTTSGQLSGIEKQLDEANNQIVDKSDSLINEFREFTRTMTENVVKAFTDELTKVIQNFNELLSDQFGENFKELNKAVGRLLEWQDNYKETIEKVQDRIEQAVVASEVNSEVISKIKNDFEQISVTLGSLKTVIDAYVYHKDQLQEGMNKLMDAISKLESGIPSIEDKVIELTDEFAKAVERSSSETHRLLEDTAKQMNSTSSTLSEALTNSITKLDTGLEHALNESLKSLGQQLTSLSNQFVSDYRPLTERLRDVVRIAEELNE